MLNLYQSISFELGGAYLVRALSPKLIISELSSGFFGG